MRRNALAAVRLILALAASTAAAAAAELEKPAISLAVGGKTLVAYLPLTIAERRGYFAKEGLKLEINDFQGGSKPLEAVVGGSADIGCGAYEHTLYMAAKGIPIKAIALQNNSFGLVIAVAAARAAGYSSPRDLKGLNIGVTGPGSASAVGLAMLLSKVDLGLKDVSVIGIGGGAGAVAAVKMGKVEAVANFDPAISLLERDGAIKPVVDTRNDKDLDALYGGPFAASSFYAQSRFIERNPVTVQAFANAVHAALVWLASASVDDIVATVPPEYYAGDAAVYRTMIERNRGRISPDGRILPEEAARTLSNLARFEETIKAARIDPVTTYDNTFIERAIAQRSK